MFLKCLLCAIFVIFFCHMLAAEPKPKKGCYRHGHTRVIDIPGCLPFNMTTNACRGFCESWSLPSIMLGYKRHPVTSLSQCCNIMDSEAIHKRALCIDGFRDLVFKSALSCSCYHCQKE